MFAKFVQEKIEYEKNIIAGMQKFTKENIAGSKLSNFTKNYLLNDFDEDVNKDDLISKIEKSNKLYFNYALRPKWTLQNFLFNNFESRPPNEIINKLDIFPFYKFYVDAIADFIKEKISIFLTKAELNHIIEETNKAIYEKLTTDITNLKIKNFFLQIFMLKCEDESEYNLESTIPYSFIKIFLEDKNYADLEKKFSTIKGPTNDAEISLKDVIKVFTNKYETSNKKELVIEEKKNVSIKQNEPEKIIIDILPEKEKVEAESQQENIYSEELVKATQEEKIKPDDEVTDEPAEQLSNGIKSLFNEKQLQKISEKIYNSDLINREKSFQKLNDYKNWTEAAAHLKEIFQINKVDIYNKVVIKFVDALNAYYNEKE